VASGKTGGGGRSFGVLRASANPAFQAQLEATREEIQIADDLPVWVTARLDGDQSGLRVSMSNRRGTSTATIDVPLPPALREAMEAAQREHRDALRNEMRDHLALNLIGAMATPVEPPPESK
jgi:hypothetical protein